MATEFASYVAAHRTRLEAERAKLPALRAKALEAASSAAARIGERVDASRVYLFGSLALGTFHASSDIDLAVEGLAPGRLVDALAAAEEGCPFRVDVLPLDSARPEIADRIRAAGVILWAR